jgi:predicted Fe-Mo cluster-binding NifX family protein
MKIVIPTDGRKGLDEKVAGHFGRCSTYTFLDENGKVVEIIGNTSVHTGGEGQPPELMKRHGASVLLCRGLGPRALDMCGQLGIQVYVCEAETVKEIFALWKAGRIGKAGPGDVCEEHRA